MKKFAGFRQVPFLTLSVLLIASQLGVTSSTAIQGGDDAKGEPFVVGIVVQLSNTSAELCSGGLVAPRIIATAAHCVVQRGVKVPLASVLIFPPGDEIKTPSSAEVIGIFAPGNYKNSSEIAEPDDIAFLVLDRPLGSTYIEEIADKDLVRRIVESKAVIRLFGYGITGQGQPASNYPRSLVLKPIDQVPLEGFSGKEDTYVSFAQEDSGAACNGDSGGPAVALYSGRLTLVSVHSASAGVCSESSSINSNWGTIPGEFPSLIQQAKQLVLAVTPIASPTNTPQVTVTATPAPTPTVSPSPDKPVIKKTTIICVKGKVTRKITALKPKCPKGFKIRK